MQNLSQISLEDTIDRIGHEIDLVDRQLGGYSRRVAVHLGGSFIEYIPPAEGHYRTQLLAEHDRLLDRILALSLARSLLSRQGVASEDQEP